MPSIVPVHPQPPKAEYNMPFLPAVAVQGGKLLFLSGCGPIPLYHKHPHVPEEERTWMSGGFRAQLDRTMANIKSVLAASGGDLRSIVKLTVYVTDISKQNELNEAVFEYFGRDAPPPRTLVEVSALSHQDMMIEIDATAVV